MKAADLKKQLRDHCAAIAAASAAKNAAAEKAHTLSDEGGAQYDRAINDVVNTEAHERDALWSLYGFVNAEVNP